MVESLTSLSRSGLRDWFVQRVTAIILAAYTLFLLIYVIACSPLTYEAWQGLFLNPWMRIFSFFALLSIVFHTWVGVWTIFTDYIKCSCLRLILQVIVILALIGYLVWGIEIVWGI